MNRTNSDTALLTRRDVIIRSRTTGLDRNPRFCQLARLHEALPDDSEVMALLQESLEEVEIQAVIAPDPFRATNPVSPHELPGSIMLGMVPSSGVPWLIPPEVLTTHLLAAGKSGGGKSNFILLVLAQLVERGIVAVKGFDRKGDYACLSVYKNFVYWLRRDFYCNLLEPPQGVDFRAWVTLVAEIMGNYSDIRVAARNLFADKAIWLYEKSHSIGVYPTIKDVLQLLLSAKYPLISHLARYCETLVNRLSGLLAVFGDNVCSHRRLDWNQFVSTNWSISLIGIPTDYQNLFITIIMAKLLLYRMVNNLRSNRLEMLITLDEASTMFKKWHETREGTYLLTDLLAKSREFGIGFVIGAQSLTNLADSVLANTATKVLLGGVGTGLDYEIFASATGMTPEQREFLKQRTLPGQACVKDPRFPYPFTLEVPRIA